MSKIENYPCIICKKTVKSNQNSIHCDYCSEWVHLNCTTLSNNDFSILSSDSGDLFCCKCLACIFPFNNIADDFEFQCCIFNVNNCNKFNTNVIRNSQQLHLTKTSSSKTCYSDIDPDKFLYKQLNQTGNKYYLEDEFNNLIHEKCIDSNFSLLHLNACRRI